MFDRKKSLDEQATRQQSEKERLEQAGARVFETDVDAVGKKRKVFLSAAVAQYGPPNMEETSQWLLNSPQKEPAPSLPSVSLPLR